MNLTTRSFVDLDFIADRCWIAQIRSGMTAVRVDCDGEKSPIQSPLDSFTRVFRIVFSRLKELNGQLNKNRASHGNNWPARGGSIFQILTKQSLLFQLHFEQKKAVFRRRLKRLWTIFVRGVVAQDQGIAVSFQNPECRCAFGSWTRKHFHVDRRR